ncbi:MAG: hypothetical protein A3H36_09100 [Chloroflexi bacterium RIFCSPLOWO2_02_FULL_71_16]|nr:MAG: hypothetical protein A2082_00280 [Chloroflexi bacterium GWC2_70_10]OGO68866.1 MAG: hypothetical protein A3H36_09100 [Chloroflexi bacterium RIFCSPLOWO2_02_FULL_71_16]
MHPIAKLAALTVSAALVLAACGTAGAPAAAKRTIYMSAVEYKGSTEVAKEPFPAQAVPAGGGYQLKEPKDGKWENSTYRWEPGTIVVYQGDDVELQIWGVNGKEHPGRIEGYDKAFGVQRGQLTTVSFKADKAGVFRILCDIHNPSMTGTLVVLGR